jgi:hypothetical protein
MSMMGTIMKYILTEYKKVMAGHMISHGLTECITMYQYISYVQLCIIF